MSEFILAMYLFLAFLFGTMFGVLIMTFKCLKIIDESHLAQGKIFNDHLDKVGEIARRFMKEKQND